MGSRAFSLFAEAAAQQGLLLCDPSSEFAEESAVRQMLAAAGYSACTLSVSQEVNSRAGQTPQQWAAAGWELCIAFPMADLPSQLAPEQLQRMRSWYLAAAEELAGRYATARGIEEPYQMLCVARWPVSDSQVGDVCLHWHSCASDQVSRELVTVQVRGSA